MVMVYGWKSLTDCDDKRMTMKTDDDKMGQ
jgi:hypothetical protein